MYVVSFLSVLGNSDSDFCFVSCEFLLIFGFEFMFNFVLQFWEWKLPTLIAVSIVSATVERHITGPKGDKHDQTGEAETHKYIKGVLGQNYIF